MKAMARKPPKGADTGPVRTGNAKRKKGNATPGGKIFGKAGMYRKRGK